MAAGIATRLLKHDLHFHGNLQQNGPAEVQCEFFSPNSGVNFLVGILGGEFLEGEFLRGSFYWKT